MSVILKLRFQVQHLGLLDLGFKAQEPPSCSNPADAAEVLLLLDGCHGFGDSFVGGIQDTGLVLRPWMLEFGTASVGQRVSSCDSGLGGA